MRFIKVNDTKNEEVTYINVDDIAYIKDYLATEYDDEDFPMIKTYKQKIQLKDPDFNEFYLFDNDIVDADSVFEILN